MNIKIKIAALLLSIVAIALLSCATSPEAAMNKAFKMSAEIQQEDDVNVHIKNLKKSNRAYRALTVMRLGEFGSAAKDAVVPLTKIAKKDKEAKIRLEAITSLKRIDGNGADATLKEISLNDKNPEVRLKAKALLGQ